jgi:hypothetical protein
MRYLFVLAIACAACSDASATPQLGMCVQTYVNGSRNAYRDTIAAQWARVIRNHAAKGEDVSSYIVSRRHVLARVDSLTEAMRRNAARADSVTGCK